MRVLLVDDESLARSRLRGLLQDCSAQAVQVVGEAGNAVQAMEALQREAPDVLLLDIHMPGVDGLTLARNVSELAQAPAVIFVTAYAEHAVRAFELDAVDYLTKPVRLERLQAALQKAERFLAARRSPPVGATAEAVTIQDRGRTERLPLSEILYFKAELKYVTVRTAARTYILDGSLGELEARYGASLLRIHRNALVARRAMRSLERHHDPEEGEGWALKLNGVDELLAVSRRQLSTVREALASTN